MRVIHLAEQLGVSVARNTGVRNAAGELISFIDSDDFVREDYLAAMVETLTTHQADIVFTEFNLLDEQSKLFYFAVKPEEKGQVYELTSQERRRCQMINCRFVMAAMSIRGGNSQKKNCTCNTRFCPINTLRMAPIPCGFFWLRIR